MRGKTAHTVRREGRFTPAPTPYSRFVPPGQAEKSTSENSKRRAMCDAATGSAPRAHHVSASALFQFLHL